MITVQEAAYEVFTKISGVCEKLCQPTLPALYEYGHSHFAKMGSIRCGNYAGSICEIIVLLPCSANMADVYVKQAETWSTSLRSCRILT